MKKLIILLTILLINTYAFAQSGPLMPCINCENFTKSIKPITGFWYNPEQSGSGLSIEIKKETAFGAYFGYNDEGKPIWFTFLGQLTPSDKIGVMWELDSDLSEFNDGNSLNSEYKPPALISSQQTIHIEFNHMTHASFSVDGGLVQNLVPLSYGVPHQAYFPQQTSITLPDLEGYWVFSFRSNVEIFPFNPYIWGLQRPYMVFISKPFFETFDDGTSQVSYTVHKLENPPELGLIIGGVGCRTVLDENQNIIGPECTFGNSYGFSGGPSELQFYNMPISGISLDKLFGETEDGHVFKAFRYDYCEFNLSDPEYKCEDAY